MHQAYPIPRQYQGKPSTPPKTTNGQNQGQIKPIVGLFGAWLVRGAAAAGGWGAGRADAADTGGRLRPPKRSRRGRRAWKGAAAVRGGCVAVSMLAGSLSLSQPSPPKPPRLLRHRNYPSNTSLGLTDVTTSGYKCKHHQHRQLQM